MKSLSNSLVRLLVVVPLFMLIPSADGAELSKQVTSSPCRNPPKIDGQIGADEWKESEVIEFDLPVANVKAGIVAKRACQLRVMNSANALYLAFRVPDPAVNKSLAPIDIDLANLAFCRGTVVAAGDDRKVIAPGLYLDKHVTTPGQDGDDPHPDGKGSVQYDQGTGIYTFEWAILLNANDPNDLQAKPGDTLRFNLAYVDAFQTDLKETQIGSVYPGGLDVAKDWGTLQLAANVQEDGGGAFAGPEWVTKLFDPIESPSVSRLKFVESAGLTSPNGPVIKVLVEYSYRDAQGNDAVGKAKIFVPDSPDFVSQPRPLYYSAGYELDDASAAGHVGRGFVVVTPRALAVNPLVQTINPDVVLFHLARSFRFIDDARVIIAGGSAGGYITLMLAAETFPLAGAAPEVPPVNWGYNAAFFLQREQGDGRKIANSPQTPVFDVIVPIVQSATKVYGDQPGDETYFRHSPVSQLETITCPVSVYWSTADMLVPIDQVGKAWVRPFDSSRFPKQFTFSPEVLTSTSAGQQRFIDLLDNKDYDLATFSESDLKSLVGKGIADLPVSETKQWSISILDEGEPEPQLGHVKYSIPWSNRKFIARVLEQKIAVNQLRAKKLERLMDRYAGREWLPTKLVHLDQPASERADVVRGLKTYCRISRDHAKHFAEIYSGLSADRKVLPAELVRELASTSGNQ